MLRQARFDAARIGHILDIIERNAKAQAQLITDALDISRMITGRKIGGRPGYPSMVDGPCR